MTLFYSSLNYHIFSVLSLYCAIHHAIVKVLDGNLVVYIFIFYALFNGAMSVFVMFPYLSQE